jgi:hypothetical protein
MPFANVAHPHVGLRIPLVVLFSAILLSLVGCDVTSINPLYGGDSDSDLAFEPSFAGSWQSVELKCTTVVTITAKDKAYDFRSVNHGEGCGSLGKELRYQGHLVKLGSHYFLDLEAIQDQVCDTCLATHWIARVDFNDHRLALTPIDAHGLGELIKAGVSKLRWLPSDLDDVTYQPTMLASRTSDLKRFCGQFATDPTVFKPESTDTFERSQVGGTTGQPLP